MFIIELRLIDMRKTEKHLHVDIILAFNKTFGCLCL